MGKRDFKEKCISKPALTLKNNLQTATVKDSFCTFSTLVLLWRVIVPN